MNDPITLNGITLIASPVRRQEEVLTEAAVDIGFAVRSCLVGGRSGAAIDVEAAMTLMDEARQSFDRAQAALAGWN